MRKIIFIVSVIFLSVSLCFNAYAGETQAQEEKIDGSKPRLMVVEYSLDTGDLEPERESELTVVFKNFSNTKAIMNLKLSISDDSGDIKPIGTGTQYVEAVYAGSKYTWKVKLNASKAAKIGEHSLVISSEYEDKYYASFSGTDTIRLNVKQTADIDYSGVQLPSKIVEGDTVSLDIGFMNTGKCRIRNLKIDFGIEGLDSGGTAFVGELDVGASGNARANLRASHDLGDKAGVIQFRYEDEFGDSYTKTVEVYTTVIEKVVTEKPEAEEEEKRNPLWWVFLLTGLVFGGAVGALIPYAVNTYRQRREDELRL